MRAIIQRVLGASVHVDGQIISSIDNGLCVLLGITKDDTHEDIDYMVQKILKLRLFDGEEGKRWNYNVIDKRYEILCVSQFTLYYSFKGCKPDFHNAMPAKFSEPLYNEFINALQNAYTKELVKDGQFGAKMVVNITNDGPVTMQLDSRSTSKINKNENVTDSIE